MATIQIFLSAVSDEFQDYRVALRKDLDRPDVTVKAQEDFVAWGAATLEKLDDYIRGCDVVIHLIGDMTGTLLKSSDIAPIIKRYSDISARLPPVMDLLNDDTPAFSFTQWEAYLAIYHNKPLILAVPLSNVPRGKHFRSDDAQREAQRAHLQRLKTLGRYPEITFANEDRLAVGVLRSRLHDILEQRSEQPRLFELIAAQAASYGTTNAFQALWDTFHPILHSENAANFAREALRTQYEIAVKPATYDHVIESFRLHKDDFGEYFLTAQGRISLFEHLSQKLKIRSESWVFNTVNKATANQLIHDYLVCYQKYFYTYDPHLSTIQLLNASTEILQVVRDVRASLKDALVATTRKKIDNKDLDLSAEIRVFLASINIPYEIVDRLGETVVYRLMDPTSVFSNQFILTIIDRMPDYGFIDSVVAIARARIALTNILLVSAAPLTHDLAKYAEARGIILKSLTEFREEFSRLASRERYFVGAFSADTLGQMLNIGGLYVEQDAVPVAPGENMEDAFLKTRAKADHLIRTFLEDDDEQVLFVLGGYGAGKSALCAHLLKHIGAEEEQFTPIYFPLRQVEAPDDLDRIVSKCHQLAKQYGGTEGGVVVILDGLDELPNAMSPEEKRKNLLRVLRIASRTEKLIVSVRSSYFRGLEDFWRLFRRKGDSSLWHDLARFIPAEGHSPNVSAIMLREFDSDQIYRYAELFGVKVGDALTFAREFVGEMTRADYGFNYMTLARNPLYLFILASSRPWNSPDVRCMADVYEIFIRYWLERDVEKGRSRWNLSTDDRFEFMYFVAFHMFRFHRHAIRFEEFDELVTKFFGGKLKEQTFSSLSLDLQTTGIFGMIGNRVFFMMSSFSDYFVASNFKGGPWVECAPYVENGITRKVEPPRRMPTKDQVHMWAGMAETSRCGVDVTYARKLLSNNSIAFDKRFSGPLQIDVRNVLYRSAETSAAWKYLDGDKDSALGTRIILNAVVLTALHHGRSEIEVKILNRKGLHARASAKLVQAFEAWREELFLGRAEEPKLTIRQDGIGEERVSIESIMGLMMLTAGPGAVVIFEYENCSRTEVEALLERFGCLRPTTTEKYWRAYFGEEAPT